MDKQNYELAEEDYIKGMKYKDIAEKYNVSINTVKSWKTRYKWCKDKKGMHTKNKKVCTQNKKSADEISWIDIENEYVTDIRKKPCSLEKLSEKYNIPIQTIKDYSASHTWSDKRTEYKLKTNQKTVKKTLDLVSNQIAKYKAKHLNISDKILNEISKSLDNEDELYTFVEKLRQGYGQGEFKESIVTEKLNAINDSKVVNLVNALEKLQKMQRQTLDILDEKDNIKLGKTDEISDYEKEKQQLDIENKKLTNDKLKAEITKITDNDETEVEDDGFLEALRGRTEQVWNNE